LRAARRASPRGGGWVETREDTPHPVGALAYSGGRERQLEVERLPFVGPRPQRLSGGRTQRRSEIRRAGRNQAQSGAIRRNQRAGSIIGKGAVGADLMNHGAVTVGGQRAAVDLSREGVESRVGRRSVRAKSCIVSLAQRPEASHARHTGQDRVAWGYHHDLSLGAQRNAMPSCLSFCGPQHTAFCVIWQQWPRRGATVTQPPRRHRRRPAQRRRQLRRRPRCAQPP
jgi:hypothetical protein